MTKNATYISGFADAHKRGHTLAQAFYTDLDIYAAEMENLFCGHWLYAGHISQVPKAGDYFLFEFDKESIIIVRSAAGDVKAHANVCRHRGSRICLEPSGSKKLFTCPYHAWSYDADGQLVSAGHMPDDFDPSGNGLHRVNVAVVEGLIFVCLSETPPSLGPLKRDLKDVFELLDIGGLKLAASKSYDISANWKLAVENYQECYHCAPAHKEFAQVHAMARPPKVFQNNKRAFETAQSGGILMQEINKYFGYAPEGAEGYQYGRNPLVEGCVSGSKDGTPLAPLLGTLTEYSGGASELMIGPLMYFLIYDDHMVGYRFLPKSVDACVCDVFWYVRSDAVEDADYDKDKLTWLWDVTTQADKEIISNNQKGVVSRFYCPGRLSNMEGFLESFLRWYLAALTA